jgi:hypothetical protein
MTPPTVIYFEFTLEGKLKSGWKGADNDWGFLDENGNPTPSLGAVQSVHTNLVRGQAMGAITNITPAYMRAYVARMKQDQASQPSAAAPTVSVDNVQIIASGFDSRGEPTWFAAFKDGSWDFSKYKPETKLKFTFSSRFVGTQVRLRLLPKGLYDRTPRKRRGCNR